MSIFSFVKPYRIPIAAALSLMLVELAVELVQPLLMAKIIDEGIVARDLDTVIKLGGIMLGISFLAFASGITNSFIAAHAGQSFGYDLREKLFDKVQAFSFTNFSSFPSSSLITRITNDVTQLQNTFFMSLRIAMRAPLLVIGGIIMAMLVNVKLSLAFVIIIPPLLIFLIWIMTKAAGLFKSVQKRLDKVNGVMRENLVGMRLIKAFARGGYEGTRFENANNNLKDKTVFALRVTEVTIPVLLLFMNLSVIAVLWFGKIEVQTGGVSVGEVVAIVNYAARITTAFSMFSWIIMVFSRARASAERVTDVLNEKIDLEDTIESSKEYGISKGEIEFDKVSFQFPNTNIPILQNLSFSIAAGETVAVLGATGAGKTSMFQLIPRLYDVTSGEIRIDGRRIKDFKLKSLREGIGYVPQEAMLFTGSIKENLAWGKKNATDEEMVKAASDAQIHDTIEKLPDRYDTLLGQKGVNLSGGQKQRLSIARALIKNPRILLLDDSTSALDLKTEARLLDSISQYKCTTVIITQKISTAKEADKILLLEDGSLIGSGDHEYLLKHSSLYQAIYESQFGEVKAEC
ncbi:ABC transporter ATP-binding protein [Mesobacillus selenatarsenatis]|uniref:Lipid A export ATP-binding/permease protein MsbA n=1 Tax=Mesobacillus selenatarsenatis (strain DSM 18680 / JCM 14380 / FERM P-15431 / SF-1) TaxID=1321606 RepID=A0A0A8XE04_MESS1|nr:ABC transporter ATP-binding protein [Mesobacillus selenatarsenatis]GAM16371.1 lipid A export ATP-binding/permease protein MsbA [Mesobacillus selenatarsenatis SF-1]